MLACGDRPDNRRSANAGQAIEGMRRLVATGRMLAALRRVYWSLRRPKTRLVLRDGAVLLVRHTHDRRWSLPGGGVKRGETFDEAARREVREETGLELSDVQLFHLYRSEAEGKRDRIALFVAESHAGAPRAASWEIAEARFVALDALPEGTSPATRRRIAEVLGGGATAEEW